MNFFLPFPYFTTLQMAMEREPKEWGQGLTFTNTHSCARHSARGGKPIKLRERVGQPLFNCTTRAPSGDWVHSPKIFHLASGRAWIQALVSWLQIQCSPHCPNWAEKRSLHIWVKGWRDQVHTGGVSWGPGQHPCQPGALSIHAITTKSFAGALFLKCKSLLGEVYEAFCLGVK